MKRQVMLFALALAVTKAFVALQLEPNKLEAYYWTYGKHPALGYYDHPPMIGWMVWLSTSLFGDGLLGMRVVTIATSTLAIWFAFLAGRNLYDEKVGRLGAILVGLVPLLYNFESRITPDAPLLLFWIATIWALSRWRWYLAGLFLGLAMLSKYHAILLPVGVLFFLVCHDRSWLRRKEPYLGALIALAIFLPNLIWNASHEWATLGYQAAGRLEEGSGLTLKHLRELPMYQLLYVTPVVCVWAWYCGLRTLATWKSAPWQDRLLASLGMPVLLFFAPIVFFRQVLPHWMAPGYPAVILLGAALATGWWRRLHVATAWVVGAAFFVLPAVGAFAPAEYKVGWSGLAAEVRKHPFDFVVAPDYRDAAEMAYHLRPVPTSDSTALGRPSESFRYWWKGQEFAGKDAVVVFGENQLDLAPVRAHFTTVGEPQRIELKRWGNRVDRYVIVRARGYIP